jgi:hypothetical protein
MRFPPPFLLLLLIFLLLLLAVVLLLLLLLPQVYISTFPSLGKADPEVGEEVCPLYVRGGMSLICHIPTHTHMCARV